MTGPVDPQDLDEMLRTLAPADALGVSRADLDASFAAAMVGATFADPAERAELDALVQPILAELAERGDEPE